MANLIERERNEYQHLIEKIEEDNLLQRRIRTFAAISSPIIGLSFLADNIAMKNYDIASDACLGTLAGFLFYQAATSGHSWTKKPTDLVKFLNPMSIYGNLRTCIKISLGDFRAYHDHAKKHMKKVAGTIDEKIYSAHAALCDEDEEKAMDITNDLLGVMPRTEFRPNLMRRLLTRIILRNADKINSPQIEKIIDAAYYARTGRPKIAEKFLERAVATSVNEDERITALCVYGNYLEAKNDAVGAREAFENAARSVTRLEGRFVDIPGSKNKVYVHDSNVIGGAFVFKTGDNKKATRKEHEKTEFISGTLGSSRNSFVIPLALVDVEGKVYSVTRRAGRFSLAEHIRQGCNEESFLAAKKSLEHALLMHIKTSREIATARKNIGAEDIHGKIERKIDDKDIAREMHNIADSFGMWRGAIHGDFHPGNIIINKKGEICIIDLEKAIVSVPYLDAVMLADNYLMREIERTEELLERYCENAFDSGVVDSFEDAARNIHTAGAIQNIRLYYRAESIAAGEKTAVKKHHRDKFFGHLNSLKAFYSGITLERLADFIDLAENRLIDA